MRPFRSLLSLVRWDLVLELRRRETVLNMTLFAVLILFLSSYGLSEKDSAEVQETAPLFLWIAVLFAGTVGLSRAFSMERESGALTGILLSPLDPLILYLAKVVATWIYVMVMEAITVAAYVVLLNPGHWERLPLLAGLLGGFTYAYVAAGVVISALTSSLRGGEVVLRILLFPIMIPVVMIALKAGSFVFNSAGDVDGTGWRGIIILLALGTVYLTAGCLLFPKVVEE